MISDRRLATPEELKVVYDQARAQVMRRVWGKWRPFCYFGRTELSRVCIGIEYIGGGGKYGLMISFLWWFIVPGFERV